MATATVTIDVTDVDIITAIQARKAGKDVINYCPVAQAARRQAKNATSVWARPSGVEVTTPTGTVRLKIPRQVGQFMADFDSKRAVAPFRFQAEANLTAPVVADIITSA